MQLLKKTPLNPTPPDKTQTVSLIIALRNEEKHLTKLLDCINIQSFPTFEVILIDDYSTDNSLQMLQNYTFRNGIDVKIINQKINNSQNGKKAALRAGIESSSNNLLLFTDADCTFSAEWISEMVHFHLQTGKEFIAGWVFMNSAKNTILTGFQSLEMAGLMGVGLGMIAINKPNICSGANLAYTKDLWNKIGGCETTIDTPSGDDVLMLMKVANFDHTKIGFINSDKAIVFTEAMSNFNDFYNQKIRWASKWNVYDKAHLKIVPVIIVLLYCVIGSGVLFCILGYLNLFLYFASIVVKFGIDFLFLQNILNKKKITINLVDFFILQLFYPFYVLYFGVAARWTKVKWKNRIWN